MSPILEAAPPILEAAPELKIPSGLDIAPAPAAPAKIIDDVIAEIDAPAINVAAPAPAAIRPLEGPPPAAAPVWALPPDNGSAIQPLKIDSLSEEAMDAAEPNFNTLDCLNKDGVVTQDEAATFCVKNAIPWSEGKLLFHALDIDHDGNISQSEYYLNHSVSRKILEDLQPDFSDLDLDKDSLVSRKEWMSFCNGWMVPKLAAGTCKDLFDTADTAEPKDFVDSAEFMTAGPKCKSVDDGNCNLFLAVAARLGSSISRSSSPRSTTPQRERGLALLRGGRSSPKMREYQQYSGSELFGILKRRHSV
jgi:hypothetical protein